MKRTVFNCIKVSIAVIAALCFLSLFVLLYSFSGIHIVNESRATDYKWKSNQIKTNMVEGFSFMRMDVDGFNNCESFSENQDVDILLMGSSQMEGVNVGMYNNTGYYLGELLPDQRVYNIGISGHQLYNCVSNLSSALKYYKPSDYVIIVTDSVDLDSELMRQVVEGKYPRIPSYDTGLVYIVQKWVPAVKVLYKNIVDWKSIGFVGGVPVETDKKADVDISSDTDMENVSDLDVFLNKVAVDAHDNNVKPIIVYQAPVSIDGDGQIVNETIREVERFRVECEKDGIGFIDMTGAFRKLYKKEHKLPHGFVNTAVGSGHLNKYGHRLIAEEIAGYVAP